MSARADTWVGPYDCFERRPGVQALIAALKGPRYVLRYVRRVTWAATASHVSPRLAQMSV